MYVIAYYCASKVQLHPVPDGKFWDFTSDLAKGDTAYTTLALGAHTDNTYFVSYFYLYALHGR